MSSSHAFLRFVRLTHLYLGVFIAPALVFFAFTGALQTFSLHETTRGSSYKPPAWAATLAQIHKKQTPIMNKRPDAGGQRDHGADHGSGHDSDHGSDHKSDQGQGQGHEQSHDQGHDSAPAPASPSAALARTHNPLPLKIFFLIVSIGLFTSTISGIYMSYKYARNKLLISALLIAGTVIPILMVIL